MGMLAHVIGVPAVDALVCGTPDVLAGLVQLGASTNGSNASTGGGTGDAGARADDVADDVAAAALRVLTLALVGFGPQPGSLPPAGPAATEVKPSLLTNVASLFTDAASMMSSMFESKTAATLRPTPSLGSIDDDVSGTDSRRVLPKHIPTAAQLADTQLEFDELQRQQARAPPSAAAAADMHPLMAHVAAIVATVEQAASVATRTAGLVLLAALGVTSRAASRMVASAGAAVAMESVLASEALAAAPPALAARAFDALFVLVLQGRNSRLVGNLWALEVLVEVGVRVQSGVRRPAATSCVVSALQCLLDVLVANPCNALMLLLSGGIGRLVLALVHLDDDAVGRLGPCLLALLDYSSLLLTNHSCVVLFEFSKLLLSQPPLAPELVAELLDSLASALSLHLAHPSVASESYVALATNVCALLTREPFVVSATSGPRSLPPADLGLGVIKVLVLLARLPSEPLSLAMVQPHLQTLLVPRSRSASPPPTELIHGLIWLLNTLITLPSATPDAAKVYTALLSAPGLSAGVAAALLHGINALVSTSADAGRAMAASRETLMVLLSLPRTLEAPGAPPTIALAVVDTLCRLWAGRASQSEMEQLTRVLVGLGERGMRTQLPLPLFYRLVDMAVRPSVTAVLSELHLLPSTTTTVSSSLGDSVRAPKLAAVMAEVDRSEPTLPLALSSARALLTAHDLVREAQPVVHGSGSSSGPAFAKPIHKSASSLSIASMSTSHGPQHHAAYQGDMLLLPSPSLGNARASSVASFRTITSTEDLIALSVAASKTVGGEGGAMLSVSSTGSVSSISTTVSNTSTAPSASRASSRSARSRIRSRASSSSRRSSESASQRRSSSGSRIRGRRVVYRGGLVEPGHVVASRPAAQLTASSAFHSPLATEALRGVRFLSVAGASLVLAALPLLDDLDPLSPLLLVHALVQASRGNAIVFARASGYATLLDLALTPSSQLLPSTRTMYLDLARLVGATAIWPQQLQKTLDALAGLGDGLWGSESELGLVLARRERDRLREDILHALAGMAYSARPRTVVLLGSAAPGGPYGAGSDSALFTELEATALNSPWAISCWVALEASTWTSADGGSESAMVLLRVQNDREVILELAFVPLLSGPARRQRSCSRDRAASGGSSGAMAESRTVDSASVSSGSTLTNDGCVGPVSKADGRMYMVRVTVGEAQVVLPHALVAGNSQFNALVVSVNGAGRTRVYINGASVTTEVEEAELVAREVASGGAARVEVGTDGGGFSGAVSDVYVVGGAVGDDEVLAWYELGAGDHEMVRGKLVASQAVSLAGSSAHSPGSAAGSPSGKSSGSGGLGSPAKRAGAITTAELRLLAGVRGVRGTEAVVDEPSLASSIDVLGGMVGVLPALVRGPDEVQMRKARDKVLFASFQLLGLCVAVGSARSAGGSLGRQLHDDLAGAELVRYLLPGSEFEESSDIPFALVYPLVSGLAGAEISTGAGVQLAVLRAGYVATLLDVLGRSGSERVPRRVVHGLVDVIVAEAGNVEALLALPHALPRMLRIGLVFPKLAHIVVRLMRSVVGWLSCGQLEALFEFMMDERESSEEVAPVRVELFLMVVQEVAVVSPLLEQVFGLGRRLFEFVAVAVGSHSARMRQAALSLLSLLLQYRPKTSLQAVEALALPRLVGEALCGFEMDKPGVSALESLIVNGAEFHARETRRGSVSGRERGRSGPPMLFSPSFVLMASGGAGLEALGDEGSDSIMLGEEAGDVSDDGDENGCGDGDGGEERDEAGTSGLAGPTEFGSRGAAKWFSAFRAAMVDGTGGKGALSRGELVRHVAFVQSLLLVLGEGGERVGDDVASFIFARLERLFSREANLVQLWDVPWLEWCRELLCGRDGDGIAAEPRVVVGFLPVLQRTLLFDLGSKRPVLLGKLLGMTDAPQFVLLVGEALLDVVAAYPILASGGGRGAHPRGSLLRFLEERSAEGVGNFEVASFVKGLVVLFSGLQSVPGFSPNLCERIINTIHALTWRATPEVRTLIRNVGLLQVHNAMVLSSFFVNFNFETIAAQPLFRDSGGLVLLLRLFLHAAELPGVQARIFEILRDVFAPVAENAKVLRRIIRDPHVENYFARLPGVLAVDPDEMDEYDPLYDTGEFLRWFNSAELVETRTAIEVRLTAALRPIDAARNKAAAKAESKRSKRRRAAVAAAEKSGEGARAEGARAAVAKMRARIVRHESERFAALAATRREAWLAGRAMWRGTVLAPYSEARALSTGRNNEAAPIAAVDGDGLGRRRERRLAAQSLAMPGTGGGDRAKSKAKAKAKHKSKGRGKSKAKAKGKGKSKSKSKSKAKSKDKSKGIRDAVAGTPQLTAVPDVVLFRPESTEFSSFSFSSDG
ncbi:uncharacterized protein AMSG_06801 [Thecamonas trahens ATCC 50062]|uniref:BEACH domain-containing protein n=1 Tax=Thecamonas trahens ATCC 50062 TaxID=461836 RepID=A0A0L0DDB0_THETB|nr:hypothetical protein AMSG_06801 [Thecamonas trahens ATCC 50062]KNC50319.1 hypothetical protein AMSG_06801 [Thecamonas trahens ATCC 50062]|eukprot:XP_013756865.1 hypothetical protein AMSG_06801 [Thecamonas trahens ATCC 50062]